jgi:spore coat polysaccharide biosynthesis predicted glycosyltransferase SpsG
MKIIILSSVDLDSGTGLRMSGLAKALAKLEHEVYLTGSGLYEDIRPAVYLGLKKKRGLKKSYT